MDRLQVAYRTFISVLRELVVVVGVSILTGLMIGGPLIILGLSASIFHFNAIHALYVLVGCWLAWWLFGFIKNKWLEEKEKQDE